MLHKNSTQRKALVRKRLKQAGYTTLAGVALVGTAGVALEFKGRREATRVYAYNPRATSSKEFPKEDAAIVSTLQKTHPKIAADKSANAIFAIASVEKDYLGIEGYTFLGQLGIYGSSVGPMQVRPDRAATVYLKHAAQLDKSPFFNFKGDVSFSRSIQFDLKNKNFEALRKKLDVSGFGGLTLGAVYYLDLYTDAQHYAEQNMTREPFLTNAKACETFLGQCGIKGMNIAADVQGRFTQKNAAPNALAPIQLGMVGYNATDRAPAIAAIQGMLNDWLYIRNDTSTPRLLITGQNNEATQSLLDAFMDACKEPRENLTASSEIVETEEETKKRERILQIHQKFLKLWCAHTSEDTGCEQRYLDKLQEACDARTNEGCAAAMNSLISPDDPQRGRACYAIAYVRALDLLMKQNSTLENQESIKEQCAGLNSLYGHYLSERDTQLFRFCSPKTYEEEMEQYTGRDFQTFFAVFLWQATILRLSENYGGGLPTYFQDHGMGRATNVLGRSVSAAYKMLNWKSEPIAR